MEIIERQRLRRSILSDLYELYFKQKHGYQQLPASGETILKDLEVYRAYEYLAERGMIVFKKESPNPSGNKNFQAYITVDGIDVVEGWST